MSNGAAIALILAGGVGERLWPLSQPDRPKQFLKLLAKNESLVQSTARRVLDIPNVNALWVISLERFRYELTRQLPQLPPANLILEPIGRGTGPSIAWSTLEVARRHGPAQVMLFTPSDHFVESVDSFNRALSWSIQLAAQLKQIVLVGMRPTFASTEYGYIRHGEIIKTSNSLSAHRVTAYVEKPAAQLAEGLLRSGDQFWNSGILISRVDVLLAELIKAAPDTIKLFESGGLETFQSLRPWSVEHALLENTHNAIVIAGDFRCYDIGNWDSLEKVRHEQISNTF